MKKLLYFSGIKPTIEDLEYQQDGIEEALSSMQSDLVSDGVVRGLLVSKGIQDYLCASGVAYISCKRIELIETTSFQSTANRYVFLQYTTISSHEVSHFLTGDKYNIYGDDSFSIVSRTDNTPQSGEVLLAHIETDGSVTDLREPVSLLIDERLHAPNTDTHTTASEFRIGGADGPVGLTVENILSVYPELRNLLRNGLINFQDGNGDQLLLTRKIPSQPNAPVLSLSNAQLKLYPTSQRSSELSLALDSYQAASIASQQISAHLSSLQELRALVIAKQIAGYTFEQLRGNTALPGGSFDFEVRNTKNDLIRNGVLSNMRLPGTVSLSSGSQAMVGNGTSFDSSYIGKRTLIDPGANSSPLEFTISAVTDSTHATLSTTATGNIANAVFYFSDVPEIGFGGSITTITGMLAGIDAVKSGKEQNRSLALQQQTHSTNLIGDSAAVISQPQSNQYVLFFSWTKPLLFDHEEIVQYLVRVYELLPNTGSLPVDISVAVLEANHTDAIVRVNESPTKQRRQIETDDATTTVGNGSTTSEIIYTGTMSFQPNQRIIVGNESGIVRTVDPGTKTITLLSPLTNAPISGTTLTGKKLLYESDVRTESFSIEVNPGQRLLLFVRSMSEYNVVSNWSNSLAITVDALQSGDGKTVAQLADADRKAMTTIKQIEREQVTRDLSEQVFTLQRAIAEAPTQEQLDALAAAMPTGAN